MNRKSLSKLELQRELNARLHNAIGHKNISFGGVTLLNELESEGSNWSKSVFMRGRKEDIDTHLATINSVIIEVSKEFNLDGN